MTEAGPELQSVTSQQPEDRCEEGLEVRSATILAYSQLSKKGTKKSAMKRKKRRLINSPDRVFFEAKGLWIWAWAYPTSSEADRPAKEAILAPPEI